MTNSDEFLKQHVSFAGAGFLGIYHVGVGACLKQYAPHLLQNAVLGASAGASVAACLLCDAPIEKITRDILKIVHAARTKALGPLSSSFHIQKLLKEGLQKVLPEDAHLRVNGRLHVSLTRLSDQKNVMVSRFYSKDDLIQALLASAFIPLFTGLMPPRFHGTRYVDGALTNNLPVIDESTTITVSPLSGNTDICPEDSSSAKLFHMYFSNHRLDVSGPNISRMARMLSPPEPAELLEICNQGFYDALRYLRTNGLISCEECLFNPFSFMDPDDLEPSDDQPYDPQCLKCIAQRKEVLRAKLPDTVIQMFEDAIDLANESLMHLVFKYRCMKLLLFISLPYTLPVDILISVSYRCATSAIATSKNVLFFSRLLTRALMKMHRRQRKRWILLVRRHVSSSRDRLTAKMAQVLRHVEERRLKLIDFAMSEMSEISELETSQNKNEFETPPSLNEGATEETYSLKQDSIEENEKNNALDEPILVDEEKKNPERTKEISSKEIKAKTPLKDSEEDSMPECDQGRLIS